MAGVNPDCSVEELFSAYLDGELAPGELDLVVGHLGSCFDCIAAFHELKAIRGALRMLPALELPDRLLPAGHHGEQLSAYLDGALTTSEHLALSSHLAACSDCREELHELDAARTAIRALPVLEPPEFLELERRRHERPARRKFTGVAAGAAAAVVAVALVAGNTGTQPDVDIDTLADQHTARVSVEPGFSIVPAVAPAGGTAP